MQPNENTLYQLLKNHTRDFHQVIAFNPSVDKIISLDFTKNNLELAHINMNDTDEFSRYITGTLETNNAKFGFGGYNELRVMYNRSELFNSNLFDKITQQIIEEPRRLHIGIDIWGEAGTEVFAPLGGMVHSFAFNNHLGDYGATIILLHQLEGLPFFTLYGHVSLKDIESLKEGMYISRGQKLAHFGKPEENGHWPPHLHFQVIKDITPYRGDYPGVCKLSESKKYLLNSPDADVILNMQKFISNSIL